MTKTIKIISVLLCAVLLISCCFVGCGGGLTQEGLVESIKTDFPEAHIGYLPGQLDLDEDQRWSVIFLFEDEASSEYLTFYSTDNNDIAKDSFELRRLTSWNNTQKIIDTVMPIIISGWTEYDTTACLSLAEPNYDFSEWKNEYNFYDVGKWSVFGINSKEYITIRATCW